MTTIKKFISFLAPVDVISILFMLFLIGLNLIFFGRVAAWLEIVSLDLAIILVIAALAYFAETRRTPLLVGVHRFYSYVFILFVFKEIYLMVRPNPSCRL